MFKSSPKCYKLHYDIYYTCKKIILRTKTKDLKFTGLKRRLLLNQRYAADVDCRPCIETIVFYLFHKNYGKLLCNNRDLQILPLAFLEGNTGERLTRQRSN